MAEHQRITFQSNFQLLEAIGVITKADRKKASGRSASGDSYQETVVVPLSRDHDLDGEGDYEDVEDEGTSDDGVQLKSVQKVRVSD